MENSKSILIGLAVNKLLKNDLNVKKTFNDRIYPFVAQEGTKMPFAVYSRDSVIPTYTKDGCCGDETRVTIIVVDTEYSGSVYAAQTIREALEWQNGEISGIEFSRLLLDSVQEDYQEGFFLQTLTFKTAAY